MNKIRKPWLAGLLTFLDVGLGHIYSGQFKKGVVLFLIFEAVFLFAMSSLLFNVFVTLLLFTCFVFGFTLFCIIDAVKTARQVNPDYEMKTVNRWYVYLLFYFVTAIVIQSACELALKTSVVQTFKQPSGSMKPTLQTGDRIVTNKLVFKSSDPKRGDIVVFEYPEDPKKFFVKRIIALGGDTVEVKDKVLLVNGQKPEEPYIIHADPRIFPPDKAKRDNYGPFQVPADCYFMMGDNRDNSHDSRFWGPVKREAIMGKIVSIYWSWDRENSQVRWNRIGKKL